MRVIWSASAIETLNLLQSPSPELSLGRTSDGYRFQWKDEVASGGAMTPYTVKGSIVKKIVVASFLSALVAAAFAQAPAVPSSIKYRATPVKLGSKNKANASSIQSIRLETGAGISKDSINRINTELANVAKEFERSAKKCHDDALGRPWGYASKLEKIALSEKYLSIIFSRETVCAGSPEFEKDPIVFSLRDGSVISADSLFQHEFPEEKLLPNISADKRLVVPDPEIVERMIDDSKMAQNKYNERCEYYLKNTSYKIWIEGKSMIFFPEFLQTDSICQKEYLINLGQ